MSAKSAAQEAGREGPAAAGGANVPAAHLGGAVAEASAPPGDGDWDVINEGVKGQRIPLGPEGILKVRLTWDSRGSGGPDLDISALCFGADGTLLEAIFYNQPAGLMRAVLLNSGDQQMGAVGEEIAVRLLSVLPNTNRIVFVVSSANDVPLTNVEGTVVSATLSNVPSDHPFSCDHITWQQPKSPLGAGPHGALSPSHVTAVPLYLMREAGATSNWTLVVLDEMASGRTFIDALPRIRELCGLPATGKSRFQAPVMLSKNDHLLIDTQTDAGGMTLRVGCGWDPAEAGAAPSDLDLSAFCFGGADGKSLEGIVYWGKLSAFDEAIAHSGDNSTGAGAGDDETMTVQVQKLPLKVQSIIFFVSRYGSETTRQEEKANEKEKTEERPALRSVSNTHFTITRASDAAELVRFAALGEGLQREAQGVIMCSLTRLRGPDGVCSDRHWGLICHGQGVVGGGVHDPDVLAAVANVAAEVTAPQRGTFRQVNLRGALRHAKVLAPLSDSSKGALPPPAVAQHPQQQQQQQQLRGQRPVWWRDPMVQAAVKGAGKKILLFVFVVLLAYYFFDVDARRSKNSRFKGRF